jgi:hypothetical protein
MEDLYTSSEAREKLGGISSSTFKILIDEGKIRKVTPPGKKQGAYMREDVDELAREMQVSASKKVTARKRRSLRGLPSQEKSEGEIDWMSERDLPYLLAYDYEMSGIDATVDIPKMHSWWQKNPRMTRVLFERKDRRNIWGTLSILPLKQETILKILKGEMEEHDITADDILAYEPGGRYDGYISAVSVKPEHRVHLRSLREDLLNYWCHHYPEIQLVKLYAVARSEGGWDLVKHLFFSPRHDLGKGAFELDLGERNPSRLIKKYQECIKRKDNSTSSGM